jgi:vacuolar-type H+-ATPase subunit E/Vma4
MGHGELLNALRRKGDDQAAALRRRVDGEQEALRQEADARRERLRLEHEERCAVDGRSRRHGVVAAAEREAALVRERAEHELALRLRERAGHCLATLRDADYAALFRTLAAELPPADWGTIRVNPLDAPLAAELFPTARVVADDAISGGLEADSADGTLVVVNTLESRLARGWDDLLPGMVAALRGREP